MRNGGTQPPTVCSNFHVQYRGFSFSGRKEDTGLFAVASVLGRDRAARLHDAGAGDEPACKNKEHEDKHARHAAALHTQHALLFRLSWCAAPARKQTCRQCDSYEELLLLSAGTSREGWKDLSCRANSMVVKPATF